MELNHNFQVRSPVYYPLYYSDVIGADYRIRTDDLSLTRRLHYHCAKSANMDRPEEFESPTSWFVAKCSNPIELKADNLVVIVRVELTLDSV